MSKTITIRIERAVAAKMQESLNEISSPTAASRILAAAIMLALRDKSASAAILPENIAAFGDGMFD